MTITIYEGYYPDYILLGCKREEFSGIGDHLKTDAYRISEFVIKCPTDQVYKTMSQIADYVNNEDGEECLFEVD